VAKAREDELFYILDVDSSAEGRAAYVPYQVEHGPRVDIDHAVGFREVVSDDRVARSS